METTIKKKDAYKTTRIMYILEAAFEYFINLLLGGAYIAKLTTAIGLSNAMSGVVTSFVSLGLGFQLIAIFLANKTPVKRWVTILHSVNQLAFGLVYIVPFFKVTKTVKIVLFIALLLTGHILNNVVNSPKINWLMGAVDDKKRGSFTANKEIFSLIGGMIFSFVVGGIIDHFEAVNDLDSAFLFCGIGIFGLTALHTVTLLFSKEKPHDKKENIPTGQLLKELGRDKNLWKLIVYFMLWGFVYYATYPFYGTYQNEELGFSMTYVSILAALYAIVRACASPFMGKIGDKYSFTTLLNVCLVTMLVAYGINIFTVPSNGKLFYTAYYVMFAIGMAGIENCSINLIYDFVAKEKRVGAFALKNTLAGFTGFFSTLIMSRLVEHIQDNGNTFFGMQVYAQQVVTVIGVIGIIGILLYVNLVVRKMQK